MKHMQLGPFDPTREGLRLHKLVAWRIKGLKLSKSPSKNSRTTVLSLHVLSVSRRSWISWQRRIGWGGGVVRWWRRGLVPLICLVWITLLRGLSRGLRGWGLMLGIGWWGWVQRLLGWLIGVWVWWQGARSCTVRWSCCCWLVSGGVYFSWHPFCNIKQIV